MSFNADGEDTMRVHARARSGVTSTPIMMDPITRFVKKYFFIVLITFSFKLSSADAYDVDVDSVEGGCVRY